ncbi:MAG: preprotein translocase subunit SecA [Gammaproteobacteria bacterium]
MAHFLSRIFGNANERLIAGYRAVLPQIEKAAEGLQQASDDDIRARFATLRGRVQKGESTKSLLPPVFALVREAAARTLAMRHFDEQLIGGMALFDGRIAEMKTGEGKTLAATLPVCLQTLGGEGAHVVTVNDYLARRDAEWMGALYRFLGLTIGVNAAGMQQEEKAAAYACDITYGTNNEFGFDYLRDNMRFDPAAKCQRRLCFAIVDEVDSILIDEARTPLIISGEAEDNIALYRTTAKLAAAFRRAEGSAEEDPDGDFTMDEKTREIHLSESGFERAEKMFADAGLLSEGGLYDAANLGLLHHLNAALKARHLFLRDRDYVVQNGEVVIVDEFTGRLMPGRRWGDGQHQAVEAKENVAVQKESQTLASISFQNYFRLYDKLAGMTGTALTEAEEFRFIYNLGVCEIPTHKKMIRRDEQDKVYQTYAAKQRAIIADIKDCAARRQPVLVGTTSIEESEKLSALLTRDKLPHNVLNAKQHEREAHIIAEAGAPGAATIATNMAGRGTDIVLGGNIQSRRDAVNADDSLSEDEKQKQLTAANEEWLARHQQVAESGGLRIIGTERHESRRIDNQLRGRSGRQGDNGSSIFYLSFEDSLLRVFATRRAAKVMRMLKQEEDDAIEAKMVSRTIENAQHKVETHNFDIRRQLLEYDDIANEQRRIIYQQREHIINAADIAPIAADLRVEDLREVASAHITPDSPEEEWRVPQLMQLLAADYRLHLPVDEWLKGDDKLTAAQVVDKIAAAAEEDYAAKTANIGGGRFNVFLRSLVLDVIDSNWRSHLSALDSLRMSIGLRGMAQKNPKQEYKREAFELFERMLAAIKHSVAKILYSLSVRQNAEQEAIKPPPMIIPPKELPQQAQPSPPMQQPPQQPPQAVQSPKIQRNAPCPCGSGKKYKKCCGAA